MNERETDSITEDMKVRVTRMRVNHGNSSVVHRGNPCDTVCDTVKYVGSIQQFFFFLPRKQTGVLARLGTIRIAGGRRRRLFQPGGRPAEELGHIAGVDIL